MARICVFFRETDGQLPIAISVFSEFISVLMQVWLMHLRPFDMFSRIAYCEVSGKVPTWKVQATTPGTGMQ